MKGEPTGTLTCICMDDDAAYPDPLIMTIPYTEGMTLEDVKRLVREERVNEVGEEFADHLRYCMAFEGDLTPKLDQRV
jgi:hypothetical protein